jgi:AraC-like DNA-binding protein
LVSKFHFIRVFKRYYGRTPNQYRQEVRIEIAKKILLKGKSIDEVCNAIGFTSKTSFISLFKKMTGVTPLAYQNKKSNFE